MSPEVRARAEALAEALAESPEYKAMVEASEALENHEAASIMLRDFQKKQSELQSKIMAGQQPTEAEVAQLQQAYQLASFNPYVRAVIEAETAFSQTLAEIQRLLAEAVGLDIPDEDEDQLAESDGERAGLRAIDGGAAGKDSAESDGDSSQEGTGKSRLWVPGKP